MSGITQSERTINTNNSTNGFLGIISNIKSPRNPPAIMRIENATIFMILDFGGRLNLMIPVLGLMLLLSKITIMTTTINT